MCVSQCDFEPSKEKKSKTINARMKTRTVLKSALNSAQSYEARFSIFLTKIFFLLQVKLTLFLLACPYGNV